MGILDWTMSANRWTVTTKNRDLVEFVNDGILLVHQILILLCLWRKIYLLWGKMMEVY